ncbi:hypothetical protein 2011_scaffold3_00010 [Bacteriophage sp.]|nr:hypothetical protein 2011_scaffold3_00010 [Bacteriophage sp.]
MSIFIILCSPFLFRCLFGKFHNLIKRNRGAGTAERVAHVLNIIIASL